MRFFLKTVELTFVVFCFNFLLWQIEEVSSVSEEYRPEIEDALKLLVSTVYIENNNLLNTLLYMLVGASEVEYPEKVRLVYYILYTYVQRDVVRQGLQTFVLDIFTRPDTTQEVLGRSHDIYHNLSM